MLKLFILFFTIYWRDTVIADSPVHPKKAPSNEEAEAFASSSASAIGSSTASASSNAKASSSGSAKASAVAASSATGTPCTNATEKCGVNEIYVPCPVPTCAKQICENIGKQFSCPAIPANYPCKAECRCKPGYYRNKIGQCISESECKQCGKNQVYDLCPVSCPPRTCASKDIEPPCLPPPSLGDPNCPAPKCRCADGYYSNDQGECVTKEECPTTKCNVNEYYVPCAQPTCGNDKCENIGKVVPCPIYPPNSPCKGECRCKDGYYRNNIGQCISKQECKQCGKNQVYDLCPVSCPPRTCASKGIEPPCFPPPSLGDPNCPAPKCRCANGYYSNDQGECVTLEECSKNSTLNCGENEIYLPCPVPSCANQTCENIGKKFNCPLIPVDYPCKAECRCKDGYYRNKIGQCISEAQCKQCPGEFEYFACDNECDNECDKLSRQNHTNCPILNIQCNPRCYCLKGYARDADNKCVPISQCPPECQENEEYSKNPDKVCRPMTCDDLGYPLKCLQLNSNGTESPDYDEPVCICQAGFVKNKDGKCIPTTECPSCGGDPNAEPGCGSFCTRCNNYKNKARACPASCILNGCECRPDYVYDSKTKKCVLPQNCPLQCGPNQVVFECANSPCLKTCATKDLRIQCKFRVPISGCKPGCVCADGYLKDSNGVCVPIDKCPPKNPICGKNEEFSDCPNKVCRAKECSELGYPLACDQLPRNNTGCGKPACICKAGFLKNKDGVCVDSNNCPSCGGDPNAQSGCGTFCITCDNYKDEGRACPDVCSTNGCGCRPNYVYDSKNKKCVLPENCPKQCGRNEVLSDCANSPCIRNCADKDLNLQCKPNPASCKPGCVCADGYLKDNNGVCVAIDECPPNEPVYDE